MQLFFLILVQLLLQFVLYEKLLFFQHYHRLNLEIKLLKRNKKHIIALKILKRKHVGKQQRVIPCQLVYGQMDVSQFCHQNFFFIKYNID